MTALQKAIARVAPSILIETIWTNDSTADFRELAGPGNCFENESPENWEAWQYEIRATALCAGHTYSHSAFLGGVWEKRGVNPSAPDYEIQDTEEALAGLLRKIVLVDDPFFYLTLKRLETEITSALEFTHKGAVTIYKAVPLIIYTLAEGFDEFALVDAVRAALPDARVFAAEDTENAEVVYHHDHDDQLSADLKKIFKF